MSSLRKTVSRRLVSVKNETAKEPLLTSVNMKPIKILEKNIRSVLRTNTRLTLVSCPSLLAVTMALAEWPQVNARIEGEEILYNDFADVSIAVSAPMGLMVPVIRNAESMSFDQIEKEIIRLATKARDGVFN